MLIKEKIVDITTGEETIVEREETANEISYREKTQAELLAKQVEAEAKAQAKADLLAKLGITQEEANLLLS